VRLVVPEVLAYEVLSVGLVSDIGTWDQLNLEGGVWVEGRGY
jgi:hypothetical protein